MFTDLTTNNLFSIFHEWLAVKEVCLLNSACCNKVVRPLVESVFVVSCKVKTGNKLTVTMHNLVAKSTLFPIQSLFKSVFFMGSDGRQLNDQYDTLSTVTDSGMMDQITLVDSHTSIAQLALSVLTFTDTKGNTRFVLWSTEEKTDFVVGSKTERLYLSALTICQTITAQWTTNSEHCLELVLLDGKCGIFYRGPKRNGMRNGFGFSETACGGKYWVYWTNGTLSNYGTKEAPPVDGQYTGYFLDGRMHGKGSLLCRDGSTLIGMWVTGQFKKRGTLRYVQGDVYTGEMVDKVRNGRGTLTRTSRTNGVVHAGSWMNDQPCGQGRRAYRNGTVYEGMWSTKSDGSFNGTVRFANGDVYVGSCEKTEQNRIYQWSQCVVLGEGEMTYKESGEVVEGKWCL